jgi:hypothetical protein
MKPTTPQAVSPEITALCQKLVPDGRPRFVELTPLPGTDPLDCFSVVEEKSRLAGGSPCNGWRIWELPRFFIEAEFHCLWQDPEGRLRDITPAPSSVSRILFVPDPERVYEGRQVNNVRRALTTHPAINDFFRAADEQFEIMNRGDRAYRHGRIELSEDERQQMMYAEMRKANAIRTVQSALPRPGRNDPCPCGSGKKFKKCHGGPARERCESLL